MADINSNFCKTCKFFQGSALGVCLRYPEQIGKAENQWCGEFVAKIQQPEMLTLPVISAEQIGQIMEKAAPIIEQKRRGRPKKGESDV